jgi:hypothetical protein
MFRESTSSVWKTLHANGIMIYENIVDIDILEVI